MIFIRSSSAGRSAAVVSMNNASSSSGPKNCRAIATAVIIVGFLLLLTVWLVAHKLFVHDTTTVTYHLDPRPVQQHLSKASDCLTEPQYAGIPVTTSMIGPFYEAIPRNQLMDVEFQIPEKLQSGAKGVAPRLTAISNIVDIGGRLACKCTEDNLHLSKYMDARLSSDGQVRVGAALRFANLSVQELRRNQLCEQDAAVLAKYNQLLGPQSLCVFTNVFLATMTTGTVLLKLEAPVLEAAQGCAVQLAGGSSVRIVTSDDYQPFQADLVTMVTPDNHSVATLQDAVARVQLGGCFDSSRLVEKKQLGYAAVTLLVKVYQNQSVAFCSRKLYAEALGNRDQCKALFATMYSLVANEPASLAAPLRAGNQCVCSASEDAALIVGVMVSAALAAALLFCLYHLFRARKQRLALAARSATLQKLLDRLQGLLTAAFVCTTCGRLAARPLVLACCGRSQLCQACANRLTADADVRCPFCAATARAVGLVHLAQFADILALLGSDHREPPCANG